MSSASSTNRSHTSKTGHSQSNQNNYRQFMQQSQLAQYRANDCHPPGPAGRVNVGQSAQASSIEPRTDFEKDVLNFVIQKKHQNITSIANNKSQSPETCNDDVNERAQVHELSIGRMKASPSKRSLKAASQHSGVNKTL